MTCERCGSTVDVKEIEADDVRVRICYKCYMADTSTSYAFGTAKKA